MGFPRDNQEVKQTGRVMTYKAITSEKSDKLASSEMGQSCLVSNAKALSGGRIFFLLPKYEQNGDYFGQSKLSLVWN